MNKNSKIICCILIAFAFFLSIIIAFLIANKLISKNNKKSELEKTKKDENNLNLEKGEIMPFVVDDAIIIGGAIAIGAAVVGTATYLAIRNKVWEDLENLYPIIKLKKRDLVPQDLLEPEQYTDINMVKDTAFLHLSNIVHFYDQIQEIKEQLALQLRKKFESER